MLSPPAIVQQLRADERPLAAVIERWDGRGQPPATVVALARRRQLVLRAVGRSATASAAIARLAPAERDDVLARRDLQRLADQTPPLRHPIRLGPRALPTTLLGWYRQAQARFGVRWQLLAAVNFVESDFGRVRNTSVAGAQGPMQFEPATWRAYGLGGDVHDPHDAILGAANYLAADGARHDERRALLGYNHSPLYAAAVLHYAHRMAHVRTAFLEYYAWSVFLRRTR